MRLQPDSPSPAPIGYFVKYHWWVGRTGMRAEHYEHPFWHIENAVGRPLCGNRDIPVRADRIHELDEFVSRSRRCQACIDTRNNYVTPPAELIPPRPDQFLWRVTSRGYITPLNGYSLPDSSLVIRESTCSNPEHVYRLTRRAIKDQIYADYQAALTYALKQCEKHIAQATRELNTANAAKKRNTNISQDLLIEQLRAAETAARKAYEETGGKIILDD